MTGVSVLVSRIDRDSGDSWRCPENPLNGEGVGGKIFILSIAMNWSHKFFELYAKRKDFPQNDQAVGGDGYLGLKSI